MLRAVANEVKREVYNQAKNYVRKGTVALYKRSMGTRKNPSLRGAARKITNAVRRAGAANRRGKLYGVRNVTTVQRFERTGILSAHQTTNNGLCQCSWDNTTYIVSSTPTLSGPGYAFTFLPYSFSFAGTTGSTTVTMPNMGEITTLYDYIKLDYVKIRIVSSNNAAIASTSSGNGPWAQELVFQHCVDYDDAIVPSSQEELLQRPETKFLQLGSDSASGNMKLLTVRNPKFITSISTGGTGVTSAGIKTGWLDCNNSSTIPHYGLKMYQDSLVPGGTAPVNKVVGFVTFYVTYGFTVKGVR